MSKTLQSKFVRCLLVVAAAAVCWGASGASAQDLYYGFEDETENSTWYTQGSAGIDRGMGNANSGQNNGWIRGSHGWHALYRVESAGAAARECVAFAQLRMTPNVTGLFFSILDAQTGALLSESNWHGGVGNGQYLWIGTGLVGVQPYQQLVVRVGFWGNGQDAWAQVDDVEFVCS